MKKLAGTLKCKICGMRVKYYYPKYQKVDGVVPNRLRAMRRHYWKYHRQRMLAGVRKRKKLR